MAEPRFIRFFPSLLIALVVVAVGYLADEQHSRVIWQERWESVNDRLDTVRSRFERRLDGNVQLTHQLAATLGPLENLDQAGFEVYVESGFGQRPEVILVELSPDFVTTFIHPLEGHRDRLGLDLSAQHGNGDAALRLRSSRSALMSRTQRQSDGSEVLVLQVPVLSHVSSTATFKGVMTVFLDIETMLRQSGRLDGADEIEVAILHRSDSDGREELVLGSHDVVDGTAARSEIALSHGSWTLLARPAESWEPPFRDTAVYRAQLAVLGGFIILSTLVANWFAASRRETIAELEAAEARLTGVIRNMPGAVFVYTMPPGGREPGPEDRIQFFNKDTCQEIWGVSAELAESDIMALPRSGADDETLAGFKEEIAESAETLRPWHYSWPITLEDGTRKWLDGRGHPTRLPDGSTRWYNLVVDATAEHARNDQFKQQQELAFLAQKNESIGKLTGGVAHDFNNLLAVIMGNQEFLREELGRTPEANAELLGFVDNSLKATERGADLTRKMLSFARRARLEPAVVDINEIVRETNAWAGRTMPESIRLSLSLGENLPAVRVDKASAENALLNLMVNARDAMPEGGTLSISTTFLNLDTQGSLCLSEGLEPGRYVRLDIRDIGKGIPTEVLPKVFDPFFTTKPPTAGSGLGLSMVKGFMEQSGGTVRISSEPGKGTLVQLFFKAMEEPAEERRHAVVDPASRRIGARILLAEDEADVRKVLVSTLGKEGYDIVEARTGDEAFEIYRRAPDIDLLLTDIVMPGTLQGTDLAQAIRCMVPGLPVIFLSGYSTDIAEPDGKAQEDDIRLSKPVARSALVAAIERSLRKQSEAGNHRG